MKFRAYVEPPEPRIVAEPADFARALDADPVAHIAGSVPFLL